MDDQCCRICLQAKPLTFEHVPPRSANNDKKVFMIDMQNWLKRSHGGEAKGKQFQRGAGAQTLCRDCNSMAGVWYVPDYAELSRLGYGALRQIPKETLHQADNQLGVRIHSKLEVRGARPLRLLKQMVTMMLAVSGPGFCEKQPALREFVLNPQQTTLPSKYRFGLSLFLGPMSRYAAHEGILHSDGRFQFVTELALPPFSMVLGLNEEPLPVGHADITHFANCTIDQVIDIPLNMDVRYGHTPYALDFQTTAEKAEQRARHS